MKKSSQRKSAGRQKRRNNVDRQSAAAALARAHPRQGHAGRVSGARAGSRRGPAGRLGWGVSVPSWRLPPLTLRPTISIDETLQRLARTMAGASRAVSIPREDRETLALLLTPFLLLAAVIALSLGVQLERSVRSIASRPSAPVVHPFDKLPRIAVAPVGAPAAVVNASPERSAARAVKAPPTQLGADRLPAVGEARNPAAETLNGAVVPQQEVAVATAAPSPLSATGVTLTPPPVAAPDTLPAQTAGRIPVGPSAWSGEIAALDPRHLPQLDAREPADAEPQRAGLPYTIGPGTIDEDPRCVAVAPPADVATHGGATDTGNPIASRAEFGRRLAVAARGQLDQFVIYNDAYRRLSYPMGDVAKLYGVCTDVVIRAYRALGVDLQVAVQRSGVGAGDPSIDHRRTETLRRFFARAGTNLPVTSFPEDYEPGDIVTYDRPQNSGSRSHIAVVSDVVSAAGRPMIVHNRGWGPQLEDGLFVDRITGHYRFDGGSLVAPPAPTLTAVGATGAGHRLARPRPALRTPAVRRASVRSASANAEPRSTAQH